MERLKNVLFKPTLTLLPRNLLRNKQLLKNDSKCRVKLHLRFIWVQIPLLQFGKLNFQNGGH